MSRSENKLNDIFESDELEFLKGLEEEKVEEPSFQDSFYMIYAITLSQYVMLADKLSSFMKESLNSKKNNDEIKSSTDDMVRNINYYDLIRKKINDTVADMVEISNKNKHFWRDCSLDIYESYFEKLKEIYLKKYKGANEVDFIKFEFQYFTENINDIINLTYKEILAIDYLACLDYKRHLTPENVEYFTFTRNKKVEFLENELGKLGYNVERETKDGKSKFIFKESDKLKKEKENSLQLKGIPNFNVKQRYEIFKRLGFEDGIHQIESKQMSKYNVLAILLGISPDNAKQLINNTYQKVNEKDLEELNNYLDNQIIKLKG